MPSLQHNIAWQPHLAALTLGRRTFLTVMVTKPDPVFSGLPLLIRFCDYGPPGLATSQVLSLSAGLRNVMRGHHRLDGDSTTIALSSTLWITLYEYRV